MEFNIQKLAEDALIGKVVVEIELDLDDDGRYFNADGEETNISEADPRGGTVNGVYLFGDYEGDVQLNLCVTCLNGVQVIIRISAINGGLVVE